MLHWIFKTLLRRLFYKPMSIEEMREKQAGSVKMLGKLPKSISLEKTYIDEIDVEWLVHESASDEKAIIYLHGGGYVSGLLPSYYLLCSSISEVTGARVLIPDYRLAPETPFPAALDDCATAYRWLLKQGISAQNIVVAGDSAGGNLTITLLMKLGESGDPIPAAAACLSPVTDLTKDHAHPGYKDPLLPPRALRFYTKSYVGDNDPHDPLVSPVFGNLRGLPPLLVHAGEDEILRDDAVRIEELAKAAEVDVRLEIYPRMWHVWQLYLALPQAIQSLDDIAQFLRSHIRPCVQ